MFGPCERELTIEVHDPDTRERVGLLDDVGETQVVQLADGPGREDVTAGLRSWEDATFDDDDVMATGSEPRGGSTSSWTSTDDQDVGDGSGCDAGRSDDQGSASGA